MATTNAHSITSTPKKNNEDVVLQIEMIINNLNDKWDLNIPLPKDVESPDKRDKNVEQKCYNMIRFLAFREQVFSPIREFLDDADREYTKWVIKLKAEGGVLPIRTRTRSHPITATERAKLLRMLDVILGEKTEEVRSQHAASPLHWRQKSFLAESTGSPKLNDSPVPFKMPTKDPKRARDEQSTEAGPSKPKLKKVKTPEKPKALSTKSTNAIPPPTRGRSAVQGTKGWRSANTSFESNSTSSVFSNTQSMQTSMLPNTQETVPDLEELNFQTQEEPGSATTREENHTSSDFGIGSSFERELAQTSDPKGFDEKSDAPPVDDELSQDLLKFAIASNPDVMSPEDILQERLGDVFVQLPSSLDPAPFRVKYEILRVFLCAGISFEGFDSPSPELWDNYDGLWQFLRTHQVLKGKPFPEKSERAAWDAAQNSFRTSERAVVLSGSLKFDSSSPTGPLYRFRLKPMKIDLSYRLGRQLGSHRFLEIDMPHITDPGKMMKEYPKLLKDLGDRGLQILLDWFVDGTHSILNRSWKPFFCKPKDRRGKKEEESTESETSHCVYFFAVDGSDFDLVNAIPGNAPKARKVDITTLLDMIRLTRKNKHQPIFKLFSRTSLALSKTIPTVVLERSQIRYIKDIEYNGEVMTDGAGRISVALAEKVARLMGLDFRPSGFQGRIGEAKGFWSIDFSDLSDEDWIEVTESQCKWVRSKAKEDNKDMYPGKRTFEVLNYARPLKSADLNFQLLPLLVERANDPDRMKRSLADLMELELNTELEVLDSSMNSPKLLRKWLGDRNPNFKERLKAGAVPFRAGLPVSLEEQLDMLLDAGFHPKKLKFVADIAIQLYTSKCTELETRLNIPVFKSAYCYMVPDFSGVLQEGEIQVNFSNFVNKASGFSDEILSGQELLVARSPAHFISDIQKVKAVWKEELMRFKDVIIFPAKGNPSLAAKLSGGDYDGDMAWVCWEPSIVGNFQTAEVPEVPDLVAQGYIRKDSTKYEDLARITPSRAGQTSLFLKKCFEFNMQLSMLGICTNFKDKVCYAQGSVGSLQAMQLSALLSSLVDQSKQGYSFNNEDFKRFKTDLILPYAKPQDPEYSKDNRHLTEKSRHVIDYLMFAAVRTVNICKGRFHKTFPEVMEQWDTELDAFYKWAKVEEKTNEDWKTILCDLEEDIKVIKTSWGKQWSKGLSKGEDVSTPERTPIINHHFPLYQAIQPRSDSPITRLLLSGFSGPDASPWALLKASALIASYPRRNNIKLSPLPWLMAGNQLAQLKANCDPAGAPRAIIRSMHVIYKTDNTFIKRYEGAILEDTGVTNIGELEAVQANE